VKASSISSNAISEAMRYQMMRMQNDMARAEKELVSGRVADRGLALGARTGQSVTLARDVDRLGTLLDSNALVQSRLASTQSGLQQITTLAQDLLPAFTTAASGPIDPKLPQTEARAALNAVTSILNTRQNGEFLFAGINTDTKPIDEFMAPGSASRAAFDAAFLGEFGFGINDPLAGGITAAEMADFIDNAVTQQFLGPNWELNWSTASDQHIMARITISETTQASLSANNDGVKKLLMATAMVTYLMDGDLTEGVRQTVMEKAINFVGQSVGELGVTQSEIGIIQNRVDSASERVEMQINLFRTSISDLEGVDPFEASTRVTSLLTQIEMSYTLTSRIQQLSLVRFLG